MAIVLFLSVIVILVVGMIYNYTSPKPQPQEEQSKPQQRQLTLEEREAMRQAEEVWDMTTYFTIMHGEYTGKLPEHIVGGHWTDMYPNIYRTKIAGINFRKDAKSYSGQIIDCMLYADPKNEYDPNAIKIVTNDYTHIGFIPADETECVRQWVNNKLPYPCRARIQERTEYDDTSDKERTYLIGNICIKKQDKQ